MTVKELVRIVPYGTTLFIEEKEYIDEEHCTIQENTYTVGSSGKPIPGANKEIDMIGAMDTLQLHIMTVTAFKHV